MSASVLRRSLSRSRTRCVLRVGGLALGLIVCYAASVGAQDATEIVRRADALTRGDTQQGTYEMTVVRPGWQRTMRFRFWSEGTDKSFIRVLEPAKERGVGFLKLDREMWQYVPRINRVIKIPPSMMLQSWMGSDFTNDDLVKESSVVDDYTHRLLGQEQIDGDEAYKIELIPKPEAPVTWARIVEWIRVDDYVPLRAEYYNERGERIRTMLFEDITAMGGRTIPARMTLIEEKKEGHETILHLEDVTYNEPIRDAIFTQQYLRRAR